jgi:hypothetical protein
VDLLILAPMLQIQIGILIGILNLRMDNFLGGHLNATIGIRRGGDSRGCYAKTLAEEFLHFEVRDGSSSFTLVAVVKDDGHRL